MLIRFVWVQIDPYQTTKFVAQYQCLIVDAFIAEITCLYFFQGCEYGLSLHGLHGKFTNPSNY